MPPSNSPRRTLPSAESKFGTWQGDVFKFDSPDAEQRWAVEAYRNGISPTDWHRGNPVDDKTRDLVLAGLSGPTPPLYRGPDGEYRFGNIHTIEPQNIRDHRQQALRGVKLADLKGPEMPGEEVIAARYAKTAALDPSPANENKAPAQVPANDNPSPPTAGIGRFAAMTQAQKEAGYLSPQEVLQHIDDGVRLLANGATFGYADNIAAAGNALFGPGEFGADYDKNLVEEQARSKAARDRSGIVGALIESAPQFVPGAGDVLGVGSDIKMYLEDPSQRTWKNFGLTALGALPFVPSVAGTIKRVDDAVETAAKLEAKVAGNADAVPVQTIDPHETRFSQATVSYKKQRDGKGYTYDDILTSMKQDGWQGEPVDVVRMPDGKLTSVDNTRILAARNAGIPVQARIRNFDDPLDLLDAGRLRRTGPKLTTWGEAVSRRINGQSARFRHATPLGRLENPAITGYPQSGKEILK